MATATAASKPTSKIEILSLVQSGQLSIDDAAKLLAAASKPNGKLTFKVSEKKAVSVYGMGRWPLTLYREQMSRLLDAADEIRQFIKDNDKLLATKE